MIYTFYLSPFSSSYVPPFMIHIPGHLRASLRKLTLHHQRPYRFANSTVILHIHPRRTRITPVIRGSMEWQYSEYGSEEAGGSRVLLRRGGRGAAGGVAE